MNQFRDLTIVAMIILAIGLLVGGPRIGAGSITLVPYGEEALGFLILARPYDIIILFALSLALFMTRLKY